jgi:hypothetical protein
MSDANEMTISGNPESEAAAVLAYGEAGGHL